MCEGGQLTLSAPPGFQTYAWSPPSLTACPDCPNTAIDNFQGIIAFSILATSANNCISTDTILIEILPNYDTVIIAAIPQGDSIFIGNSAYFNTGIYFDTLASAFGGCDSIIKLVLTVFTSSEEYKMTDVFDFQVHPNPFSNAVSFYFTLPHSAFVLLRLTDVHGREIARLAQGKIFPPGRHLLSWEPSAGLPPGLYFADLQVGQARLVRKLVKI
ncbi:MAG: T9SS type A sorting domain-containing protein [Bacteroidota bacterium]